MDQKSNFQYKIDAVNGYYELLKKLSKDHSIYFFTVTFKNPRENTDIHKEAAYFIKCLRESIDKKTMNKSSSYQRSCIIFMYPELDPQHHYHGFILIHNDFTNRFLYVCTVNHPILSRIESPFVYLTKEMIDPYRKIHKDEERTMLFMSDYRLYKTVPYEDLYDEYAYSKKRFIKDPRLTTDHIILESRLPLQNLSTN